MKCALFRMRYDMAYVCSYCVEDVFSAPSEILLLNHIRLVHSCDPNFSIQCSCSRTFSNFRTFQNHRRTCTCHIESSPEPAEDSDTASCFSEEQGVTPHSIPSFSAAHLQSYGAKWILKTSETRSLTRTATLGIVQDVADLVAFMTQMLGDKTREVLQQNEVDDSIVREVGSVFNGFLEKPFAGLTTFHQQLQYYREHLGFIVSMQKYAHHISVLPQVCFMCI